jgi:hypothetical protein
MNNNNKSTKTEYRNLTTEKINTRKWETAQAASCVGIEADTILINEATL